jgi:hypothetical protein
MKTNEKLNMFSNNDIVKIMIFGLGSVGSYLLDYLISSCNENVEIVVVGRDKDKLTRDVNIIKTATMIRGLCKNKISIDLCNLDDIKTIERCISYHRPNIIVNASRVFAGLKYGSISWSNVRAYGIWAPLSVKYIYNIMQAYDNVNSDAIVINTSYSDATNAWLKSAGISYPDFGSGNINHLIPRIKFAVAKIMNFDDFWNVDVTYATSHFHDVVISKEGHDEKCKQLLNISYHGRKLVIDDKLIFANCAIPMPVDQKRNMMNASSNFEIINAILKSKKYRDTIKLHIPGADGEIGGYPYLIATNDSGTYCSFDENYFSLDDMRKANKESIYLDGIEDVKDGYLIYTDELIKKVQNSFGVKMPKSIHLTDSDVFADVLINHIIKPNSK